MKITEYKSRIDVIIDNKEYVYCKPYYENFNFDYASLIKKLINSNIFLIRIGIRSCNVESSKKN